VKLSVHAEKSTGCVGADICADGGKETKGNSTSNSVVGISCMFVSDDCHANTCFGIRWSDSTYKNEICFDFIFTSGQHFPVKEIKSFEITNSTALATDLNNDGMAIYFKKSPDKQTDPLCPR
jgi:hypothetical protein